jgi:hypothetical protein
MPTDLQVGTSTQVAPIRSDISLPVHDSPQIDLDTGHQIINTEGSKLDQQAIEQQAGSLEERGKYAPKKFWNGEQKKQFSKLDPKSQKAWLDSFDIVEKSYNKAIKGLTESYRQLDDVAGVLAPYVEEIVNVWGVSPATYLANLIEADKEASRDPVQYILKIMGAKGLTFSQLGAGVKPMMDDAANRVKLAPVMDKINELEQKLINQQQVPQEPAQDDIDYKSDEMANEIREFYGQTDSSGRELYPSWKPLLNQILPQYLEGVSLDDAYNAAVENYRAKIPANETKVSQVEQRYDDVGLAELTERQRHAKEKELLVNVIDQLKQKYQ